MMRFRHSPRYLLCLTLLTGAMAVQGDQGSPAEAGEQSDSAPEQRAPLAERSDLEALALERQLAANEQQRLDAAGTPFLALWLPANDPAPKGAVILLPGDDESADAPRIIGPLRHKLPDAGWHSLSVSLPDPQGANLPVRTAEPPVANGDTPAEQPEEPAAVEPVPAEEPTQSAEDARAAHVERVFARIDASLAFAEQQQAKTIVLLGHGSGAYWAARYIAERTPGNLDNLLLVNIREPEGSELPINDLLVQIKANVGDFYYRDSPTARQAAQLRKQISQRQQQPTFVQIGLDALPGNPGVAEEQLFRRLRGWLDKQTGTSQ